MAGVDKGPKAVDKAAKGLLGLLSAGQSRAVPRAEIEELLSESGIDLSSNAIANLLAANSHDDGTMHIDTDKSNIVLRVRWGGCGAGGGEASRPMARCLGRGWVGSWVPRR